MMVETPTNVWLYLKCACGDEILNSGGNLPFPGEAAGA